MNQQSQGKLNWRSAVGALAIFLGAFGIMESPAEANSDQFQDSFELAQVGVRSRINPPTPLNLRPRTHFPLPRRRYNQRHDYYRHSGYRGLRRGQRQYRGSHRYDRYDTHRRRNRRRGGSVIIINPANSSRDNNYDGYIRVIRK